jgi:hypothetical protein
MAPNRENRVNLLVTSDERAMLRTLADRAGVTMSDYLRLYIRREYAALEQQPAKPSKKPKRK